MGEITLRVFNHQMGFPKNRRPSNGDWKRFYFFSGNGFKRSELVIRKINLGSLQIFKSPDCGQSFLEFRHSHLKMAGTIIAMGLF